MTIWMPTLEGRSGPLYLSIADALAEDVRNGRLLTGMKLPTHRDLAYRLGVTIGTVSRAYAEAQRRGLIGGEVGRGTFVRDPATASISAGAACLPELSPLPSGEAGARLGEHLLDQIYNPADGGDRLDLSLNYPYAPTLGTVLDAGLRRMTERRALDAIAQYQPPNGMRVHREAGVQWLARQGLIADPDDVLVVPGCQGGLSIALMALTRPGDVVLHEALT